MTAGPFAAATAVRRTADDRYSAEIAPDWDIAGNANGGYLLAIAARAMIEATGRPDPVTITGHFLAPGRPGPVAIDTDVAKIGRRFADSSAVMHAGGKPMLTVLGAFGDLSGDAPGDVLVDGAPPDLPPIGDCVRLGGAVEAPPFMSRVGLFLHPDDAGFATGRRSGVPRVTGWFELSDGEPIDTVALLCALDAFPPTIFNTDVPRAWTPTVELTVHIRARPAAGRLRCRFTTRFITSGFLEEEGEAWDEQGRLVAQSRQLALVPLAPA